MNENLKAVEYIVNRLKELPEGEALKVLGSVSRLNHLAVEIKNVLDSDFPGVDAGNAVRLARQIIKG